MRKLIGAIFRFHPFSKQQRKLLSWWMPHSPYRDHDMVVATGSVRSGKTIAMIDGFIIWALSEFENENFILAGRSIGALKRNVLNPLFAILRAKGIEYRYVRSDEHFIQIGTNTFYCFGASTEASQDTLQGLTAAGALGDEVALMPWSFVEQMIARCSVDGSKLWFNCNPEGPNHKVKTELIDKADEKMILVLQFVLDDNLTLSQKIKDRYKRLFAGLMYKRYILGLWVLAEGVIYDMFDADKHVRKDADGPLPTMREWYMSIDYGTAGSDFVAILIGIGEDDRLYFVREWRWNSKEKQRRLSDLQYSKRLRAWIDSLKKELGDCEPRKIYPDPSAASFIVQMYDDGWQGVTPADNSVLDGIRYFSTLISADRWRIHESCSDAIDEFHSYIWDEKAQERGEDKPLKQRDHSCDAGRYGVMGTRRITRHWIKELDKAA
jgi:PBSX family phage terminase large subunit